MSEVIKALSLWQPWASAVALGYKQIETRSWPTKYRGSLLIHAGKRATFSGMARLSNVPLWRGIAHDNGSTSCFRWLMSLPLGALIAVAELVNCALVERLLSQTYRCVPTLQEQIDLCQREMPLGDFSPGRYGWVLANVRALPVPIPYRGRQGLFNVPAEILADCGVAL